MTFSRRAGLLTAAVLALPAARAALAGPPFWRVHDTHAVRAVGYEDFFLRLADADAVFVGEEHDDPETHQAELYLLENLHQRWGQKLTLAMEMFERDGQAALDDYLSGRSTEAQLGKTIALWSNYRTDYRPLVEYARARRVPVIGSNVPRGIARDVSQNGAGAALAKLPEKDKSFVAAFTNAPDDDYFSRFKAIIGEGHGGPALDATAVRRFYEAQCLKDDTMAESVVRALEAGRRVLHINGTFHSDAGLGLPARILWRKPVRAPRIILVKIVPVRGDLARAADTGKGRNEADFLLFVPDRRKLENKEP